MFVAGGAAVHVPAERHRAGGGQERRGQVAGQPPALQVADQPLAELCIVTIFLTRLYLEKIFNKYISTHCNAFDYI